jgi:hypothetical protein
MADIDYGIVRRVANKRTETLKDNLVYSVDNTSDLHYIRGQIKGIESLLQDLKDLQEKQQELNDKELRGFEDGNT